MVVNALRNEKHISHYNLQEAIDLVNELQIPEAYFTHISHQLGKHKLVGDSLPRECTLHSMGLYCTFKLSFFNRVLG